MTAIIQWFTATDKGTLRKVNEDSVQIYPEQEDLIREPFLAPPGGRICILADGMGGHRGGQEASQTAVRRIAQYYYNQKDMSPDQALHAAVVQTGHDILAIGQTDPELQQMGTTVVAAAAINGSAYIINVGDSRAYLFRNRQLAQISVDDSWVQQQVRMQTLSVDQAKTHLQRNLLTQFLGTKQELRPHLYPLTLQEGDILLLCTDGVFDVISQEMMTQMLSVPPHQLPQVPHQMIEQAMLNGTSDNVTAAVGYYGPLIQSEAQGQHPPALHQRSADRGVPKMTFSVWYILAGVIALLLLGGILGFTGFILSQGKSAAGANTSENQPTSPVPSPEEDKDITESATAGSSTIHGPRSITATLPLITILPIARADLLSDEVGTTTFEKCADKGIIVSRQTTGTSPVKLTVAGTEIEIAADKLWHPACVPVSESSPVTVTAGDITKDMEPTESVLWVEYAEEVTIYGSDSAELTDAEKDALRACTLSQARDAAVIISSSNLIDTVVVNGDNGVNSDFADISSDTPIPAPCTMNASVTRITLKNDPTVSVAVALEPRHYYVVRLAPSEP